MMESVPQSKEVNPINPQGSVALYWDFENLHAGVFKQKNGEDDDYAKVCGKPQEALMDVAAVLAETLGTVVINRAFGHWGKFQRYRVPLLEAAVDLVQLFPVGANGKNGADIRLCLDVMEDMLRYPHIQTIVIAAGDSDYLPLVHKIKATGRKLYGIGGTLSTNQYWAKSCHGFTYYEDWIQSEEACSVNTDKPTIETVKSINETEEALGVECTQETVASTKSCTHQAIDVPHSVKALVVQSMLRLSLEQGKDSIEQSGLMVMMRLLEPDFKIESLGFHKYRDFIQALSEVLTARDGKHNNGLRLSRTLFHIRPEQIPAIPGLPNDFIPTARLAYLLKVPLAGVFRLPIFNEQPSLTTLGKSFIAWVKKGLSENRLSFNTSSSWVHLLNGKAFLENKRLFRHFRVEHPELERLKPDNDDNVVQWIKKAVMSLMIYQKSDGDGYLLHECILAKQDDSGEQQNTLIKGFFIEANYFFDTIPDDSSFIQIKPKKRKDLQESKETILGEFTETA